jgi:hypothetical protein
MTNDSLQQSAGPASSRHTDTRATEPGGGSRTAGGGWGWGGGCAGPGRMGKEEGDGRGGGGARVVWGGSRSGEGGGAGMWGEQWGGCHDGAEVVGWLKAELLDSKSLLAAAQQRALVGMDELQVARCVV